ncbi:MAG TPA: hypothetical protein VH592_19620 [Gemmataceae bacterium]|jgi:hypothetical protein
MPPETELIKQQMGQTRAALTEKMETLENKVLGTVNSTTDTISQTVQDVGATVTETTHNVRATLRETIDSVRDALDVSRQIHQHPWVMMAGSVAAGYVGGVMLDNLEHGRLPSLRPAEQLLPRGSEIRERMEAQAPARSRAPGFLKALADTFAPELERLKAAALGMALGVVRDKISDAVPPQMREDFHQMMDRVTTKLGGEAYPVGMMGSLGAEEDETNGAQSSHPMGIG